MIALPYLSVIVFGNTVAVNQSLLSFYVTCGIFYHIAFVNDKHNWLSYL